VAGVTGLLARPGCVEQFAKQIAALADDSVLRRGMGADARKRSLDFSWDETMARILGYYEALPGKPA
jgi:phosphatidylinositol alpha 1,6-mannosyltransferase